MTLRENIAIMTDIANKADGSFNTAKNKLLSTIASNRTELIALSNGMPTAGAASRYDVINTFDTEYINLFTDSFRTVDGLLDKLFTQGELDEAEFTSDKFKQIGIEYFPQGPVYKYLMNVGGTADIKAGDVFQFSHMNNYSTASYGAKMLRWPFPEKFYYDSTHGGLDYGAIYLHVPKDTLSMTGDFWHEDIQAYGPFKYGQYHTDTQMPYDELLSCLTATCGRVYYNTDSQGKYAEWSGGVQSLLSTLYVEDPYGRIPYEELGTTAQDALKKTPLMVKTEDDKEYFVHLERMGSTNTHYIKVLQPKPKNVPTPLGVEFPNDNNPDGHEAAFTVGTINTPLNTIATFSGNKGTTGYTCLDAFTSFSISWMDIQVYPPPTVWYPPTAVKQVYVRYSNDGQMLYNFNKFLAGSFGQLATVHGLDALVQRFSKSSPISSAFENYVNWFSKEAREFDDPASISAKLSTPRSIEQAAALYAIKFSLMKVMYGHARRIK